MIAKSPNGDKNVARKTTMLFSDVFVIPTDVVHAAAV